MTFSPNGIYTALVTPFTEDDTFDVFRRLIDFQIAAGASGLLVIGGSGEFVSLTPSERQIDQTARRVPVIVGALAPGTREVQETTRYAAKSGADAVLVLPCYCPATISKPAPTASASTSPALRIPLPFRSSPTTTPPEPDSRSTSRSWRSLPAFPPSSL
jgi:hypothetical protein